MPYQQVYRAGALHKILFLFMNDSDILLGFGAATEFTASAQAGRVNVALDIKNGFWDNGVHAPITIDELRHAKINTLRNHRPGLAFGQAVLGHDKLSGLQKRKARTYQICYSGKKSIATDLCEAI
jgi:hypothetical protein